MTWKEQSAQSGGRGNEGRERRPSSGSSQFPPGSNEWGRNKRNKYQNVGGWNVPNNQFVTAEGLQQLLSQLLPGEEQKEQYKLLLENRLDSIKLPTQVTECKDVHCRDPVHIEALD